MLKSIKSSKIKTSFVIFLLIFFCCAMYYVDVILNTNYITKTICKVLFFFILPCIYFYFDNTIKVSGLFKMQSKRQLKYPIFIALVVYLFILLSYFIFSRFINLGDISTILINDLNINKSNFIFVFLYISFINSLLEEFFFRGFIFFSIKNNSNKYLAYIISSLGFATYHIGMLKGWFNIFIFLLIFIGLFCAGTLFNYMNEKNNNIYNSWVIHMFANFSINTIGTLMFLSIS